MPSRRDHRCLVFLSIAIVCSLLILFTPISKQRSYLAAGASDQITRMWNVQNGQRAMDLDAQALSVAFSSDGRAPAEELEQFNQRAIGKIEVMASNDGEKFEGDHET